MTLNEFSNDTPINITDIISICKDFNNLGWKIQNQIEEILEIGIEEAIINGSVKSESLPFIKFFLNRICNNPYFGDAVSQARDCLNIIHLYEDKFKIKDISTFN